MKYKSKIYAKALAELVLDKKTSQELRKVTDNFIKLLVRNGDIKKARDIIRLAQEIVLSRNGNRKIILETARDINDENLFKSFIKKGDIVEKKINPGIIAGIRITADSMQFDASLSAKLKGIL